MPDTSYIIAATARSGSSLLGEALRSTGLAGRPREFFMCWHLAAYDPERLREEHRKRWLIPDDDYLRKVFEEGTTPNGVFGVKIMWGYFKLVVKRLRALPQYRGLRPPELLDTVFPGLRYIHIVRADKVRQAVSLAKATQSGIWSDVDPRGFEERVKLLNYKMDSNMMDRIARHKQKRKELAGRKLEYDFYKINRHYRLLLKHEEAWEDYFKRFSISPFRVVYEDFSESYEETAVDILKYLDVPLPEKLTFTGRALKKQGDAVNDEWVERFREDMLRPPSLLRRVLGRLS
jgi:LPS sulfotransferase NodH